VSSKSRRKAAPVIKTEAPTVPEPRGPLAYAIASLLLLIPCNWQSHIEAGDLGSHVYNAWLAELIGKGQAPGLEIARQSTNVLFDLVLSALLRFGVGTAEHIAVSLCVLTFAWGAFAFVSVVGGRQAWHLLPAIAMLAYGWVYHIGFFNFYWSLGFCFGALALLWNLTAKRAVMAVPLLMVAYFAHSLPVGWAIGVAAYRAVAVRITPAQQRWLAVGCAAAIVGLRFVLGGMMTTRWFGLQILFASGLDQLWVFDDKYVLPLIGLFLLWGVLLAGAARRVLSGTAVQIAALTAFGIFVLPMGVLLPGYKHLLSFISQRMSLALAVTICAALAAAPVRRYHWYLSAGVAALFFAFLLRDEVVLNGVERQMAQVVAPLPSGQRVTNGVVDSRLRVDPFAHMADRVCVEHCYSFANYEPSTAQFRVRAVAKNPIVVADYGASYDLQTGTYIVQPSDAPLFQIVWSPDVGLLIRPLAVGQQSGVTDWNPL
jgi:hypothetical protein